MQIDQNKFSPGVVLTPTLGLSGELVITVCIQVIAFSGLIGKGRTIGQFVSFFLLLFFVRMMEDSRDHNRNKKSVDCG